MGLMGFLGTREAGQGLATCAGGLPGKFSICYSEQTTPSRTGGCIVKNYSHPPNG